MLQWVSSRQGRAWRLLDGVGRMEVSGLGIVGESDIDGGFDGDDMHSLQQQ